MALATAVWKDFLRGSARAGGLGLSESSPLTFPRASSSSASASSASASLPQSLPTKKARTDEFGLPRQIPTGEVWCDVSAAVNEGLVGWMKASNASVEEEKMFMRSSSGFCVVRETTKY